MATEHLVATPPADGHGWPSQPCPAPLASASAPWSPAASDATASDSAAWSPAASDSAADTDLGVGALLDPLALPALDVRL
ncbi:MAG: hypothetical protein AMS14_11245 [Planctomycetes bacterium DG_20]|nr:MAG: hypothetical protein AMS14_11245 [Planctomycetes bacterium DG_20]